ncbi:Leishmanolysin-like peptidase, partial [Schistosoma japonicum]
YYNTSYLVSRSYLNGSLHSPDYYCRFQVGLFIEMNLPLIVLYLLIFNEKLTECFKVKNTASGTKHNKRNMQQGDEFIVGDKFRIQVVMSEGIKNHIFFRKFKKVFKKAVNFWTKAIHPKIQSKHQILIERKCSLRVRSKTLPQSHYCPNGCNATTECSGFQIPEKYLKDCRLSENDMSKINVTKPADADFVLFVGLNLTSCSKRTLARADICQQDSETDRPVSATISICSAMDNLKNNQNKVKKIIIHELAHCFGFRYSMLPYLRYENGDPRTRRNILTRQPELGKHVNEGLEADQNTIKYVWREWQTPAGTWRMKRVGLTLPGVVSFAREHFGCDNLDAVELESDGGRGSDFSHFERRLSIGEIMSAVHDPMAAVSNLTLFYFNETGWYYVNFLMAELWKWGKNQGCEFLYKSCGEFIKRQKMSGQQTSTWCDKVLSETSDVRCIPHTNAYGYCNLIKHSHYLKPEYTHFNNLANISTMEQKLMGGMDSVADYCPFMSVFTSINQSPMNSHCEDTDNQKFQSTFFNLCHNSTYLF